MKRKTYYNTLFENYLSHDLHIGGGLKTVNRANKPFLEEFAKTTCVFDLSHTFMALSRARQYVFELQRYDKKILFVGAPKHLEKEFSLFCEKSKHYCIQTWFYALFTNFSKAYQTKRKILLHVKERPSLIFIFDLSKYKDVVKEAKRLQIPIMAFASSDDDSRNVDYLIPGNGKSEKGGLFIFNFFMDVFSQAKKAQVEKRKELQAAKEAKQRKLEKVRKERELAKQRSLKRKNRFFGKKQGNSRNRRQVEKSSRGRQTRKNPQNFSKQKGKKKKNSDIVVKIEKS